MVTNRELLDIVLVKGSNDSWTAKGDIETDTWVFVSEGKSIEEAIGRYMLNNREALNFQFGFVDDGQLKLSTKFGKPRTADEMGPNEKKYLGWAIIPKETDEKSK